MGTRRNYWLMKSEPDVFSITDLERAGTEPWDGIRNYQARNFMRDEMRVGDRILFYHSNARPPGVAGLAEVCRTAYPDHTAWDETSPYHDPRSTPENPVWVMVDVKFIEAFPAVLPLDALKADPALDGMLVTRRGQRLSIQPVSPQHFRHVVKRGRATRAE